MLLRSLRGGITIVDGSTQSARTDYDCGWRYADLHGRICKENGRCGAFKLILISGITLLSVHLLTHFPDRTSANNRQVAEEGLLTNLSIVVIFLQGVRNPSRLPHNGKQDV